MDAFFTNDEDMFLNLTNLDNLDMAAHQSLSEEDGMGAVDEALVQATGVVLPFYGSASIWHQDAPSGLSWIDYVQSAPTSSMQASPIVDTSLEPFQETNANALSASARPLPAAELLDFDWGNILEHRETEIDTQLLLSSKDNPSDQVPNGASSNNSNLRCSRRECRHRTFKGKYEYRRHLNAHTIETHVRCPVSYCRRHHHPFKRMDKLSEHIRLVHSQDELGACPIDGCPTVDMPLILLGWHCLFHWSGHMWFKVLSRERHCCLKKCKYIETRSLSEYQAHLLGHDIKSRQQQQGTIRKMGLAYDTANITCPVCQSAFDDLQEFRTHIKSAHPRPDPEHLRAFVDFWESNGVTIDKTEAICARPTASPAATGLGNAVCPYCMTPSMSQPPVIDHHLHIQKTWEEVRVQRAAILCLLPEFIYDPIFDNDLPQVSRNVVKFIARSNDDLWERNHRLQPLFPSNS